MHYQGDFDHLFQPNSSNHLRNYLRDDDDDELLNLPRQIPNNPFHHSKHVPQNRPFYSRNQQSISKCAVTQISSKADDDYEESITPVCQKLFDHHTYSRIEKEFDLPQTLPSEQLQTLPSEQALNEATFKPNDLLEYLRGNGKEQEGSKLKQILRENVFNQSKPLKERQRVASLHTLGAEESRQKTKYEKILEQYFNNKPKKQAIKSRLSQQKMPNIKMQYLQHHNYPTISSKVAEDCLKNKQKSVAAPMMRSRSEKQIGANSKITPILQQRPQLTKTFSQQNLRQKAKEPTKNEVKELTEGWMKMSFQQRQSKTLENRKLKENTGLRMNQEKQVKHCTFKPAILQFKPPKQRAPVAGSYAKLYFQKVRRRL